MDLGEVERELCRIPEVRAARIVADDHGHPIEIHILATTGKGAKQLVRDVQSVAIATSGIDFDHRIVSVVQLDDVDAPMSNPNDAIVSASRTMAVAGRVIVDSVVVVKHELRAVATVTLRRSDERVIGTAEGTVATTARWRMVADATLDALRGLDPAWPAVDYDVEAEKKLLAAS